MKDLGYPIVMVSWLDSQGGNHWEFERDLKDDYELPVVRTYGVIIRESENWVLMASSFMPQEPPLSNQIHSTMYIPRVSILSIVDLDTGGTYVRSND